MRSPVIRGVFPTAIFALCFLVGCGSSGSMTPASSVAKASGACGLVSNEEVEKAIGQHVSEESESRPNYPPTCNYVNSEGKVLAAVAYDPTNAQEDMKTFERAVAALTGPGSTLPGLAGLAEHAHWYGPGATLVAERGNEYFSVTDGELPAEETEGVAIDLVKSALLHRQ
jgi:hypothetical protein